jgi:hypothetical protein
MAGFAQGMSFQQAVGIQAVRNRSLLDSLTFKNPVKMKHFRGGVLLREYDFFNDITNVGKNSIFDVYFNSGTQIAQTAWCLGLMNASGYSANPVTDTMAAHSGWTEFTTYSQSTRVAWGSGAASGQSVTNATPGTFDITSNGTLKGIFVTSQNTKSGNTGTLWATALFGADVPVTGGDQIKITYTVSA